MSLAFMQFRSATWAASIAESPSVFANTIPGESSSLMFLSRWISCVVFVKPGVDPVPHTRERFNELISDDLPTFGNPAN